MDIQTQKLLANTLSGINEKSVSPYTTTGKVVSISDGIAYVQFVGSDIATPIQNSTVTVSTGDTVEVQVSHSDTHIVGNRSDVAASSAVVESTSQAVAKTEADITDLNKLVNIQGNELNILNSDLDIQESSITAIESNISIIESDISAINSDISTINSDITTINSTVETQNSNISTINSNIRTLNSTVDTQGSSISTINSDIESIESNISTIDSTIETQGSDITILNSAFTIQNGELTGLSSIITNDLDAEYVKTETLEADYAEIDLANVMTLTTVVTVVKDLLTAGNILSTDVTSTSGSFTHYLTGVKIVGDLIVANTLKADTIILTGTDGLYYQLNANSLGIETVALDQETYSTALDGSTIVESSITAQKISVEDLVAFGATIGGFLITNHTIKSTNNKIVLNDNGSFHLGEVGGGIAYNADTNVLGISGDTVLIGSDEVSRSLGETVCSVMAMYAVGNSATEAPTLGWTTNSQSIDAGSYIWEKFVTQYCSGNTSETTPVCIGGTAEVGIVNLLEDSIDLINSNYTLIDLVYAYNGNILTYNGNDICEFLDA